MDLSILMPARNEMFLSRTIENVLANMRGDTEIIAVCDGAWPAPAVADHPRVQLVYRPSPIGQRAGTNLAAKLSTAKYVMKLDAHCAVDEGFDVTLMADCDRDWTVIPAMYNLHAFNWKCRACGRETYQGPTPLACVAKLDAKGQPEQGELDAKADPCGASAGFDRVMVWAPRHRRAKGNGSDGRGALMRTEFWRFDQHLHFQYWDSYGKRPEAQGDIADVMSSVGACFFMRRDRFIELGGLDEAHGSWGQFGTEIACKSWLSGGRHVVNKKTWFAHLFRTQGGDFGFPYQNPLSAVEQARAHSRKLWIEGTWPGATRPLSWLVQKFAPVPDWPNQEAQLKSRPTAATQATSTVTKGLAYYSDCQGDQRVLEAVRAQLQRAAPALPLVSATLLPIDFGKNIYLALARGYLTMFKQQLAALEALKTDVVFMVEHDVLYHPSHFDFTPAKRDVFYYNQHTYKVDAQSGQALFYLCSQVSGLCAYRELLVEHYRKRVAVVERDGFDRNLGFEPGTNGRARALDPHGAETWMSAFPNVDIRHGKNLTPSRWRQDQFRNQNSCLGWKMVDAVPGWGVTKGRFRDFLNETAA